jgi:Ca2+-binding RTX toxin-like protein
MATIRGTSKNDTLRGTPHNDVIKGLGGNDSIFGNRGDDRLFGGPGFDKFFFAPGSGRDDIFDFQHGDKIGISKAYGWTSKLEVLQDAASSSGGDTQIGLNHNDPGADSPRIIIHGLDNIHASDFFFF